MHSDIPKQYLPLVGKPVIQHTLQVFSACARITSITVVLSPDDAYWGKLNIPLDEKTTVIRNGGASRAATVLNGMEHLNTRTSKDSWVLVHDAVRPGLSHGTLDRLLAELENDPVGGILAVPLADTLKRADKEQRVATTESRENLWQAQTPQMFRFGLLQEALLASGTLPTDEAQAVEALGLKPKLVPGEARNLKITYPQDLQLAEAIIKADREVNDD